MNQTLAISPEQLAQQNGQAEREIIDVRTGLEFREVHAESARNVPLDMLDPGEVMKQRHGAADDPLYLICKSGNRASKAQQKFTAAGYTNVINIAGGTDAWVAAGLPVVRGKKAISLERQVRIAAGSIVLVGAIATLLTGNVYLAGIPAFIGAGLMFAGITDTCGMGMLLAKMPWNRVPWNRVPESGGSCAVK